MKKTSAVKTSHVTRNAVLWIISPFIVLVTTLLFNLFFRVLGIDSAIVNMTTTLLGISGSLLIFLGPIVGITLLLRKK